jgi:uncharacterized protein YcnI
MALRSYVALMGTSLLLLLAPLLVSAHAVVKPSSAGIGTFQTFSLGIPNEKDVPTIGVRLIIPEGLQYVSPNVKLGWSIVTKKETINGQEAITEINWTGGNIPAGQRDDFVFSAKVPAQTETLPWKAYQTYQNGTTVAWDQASESTNENSNQGPYSTTSVVNDLSQNATAPAKEDDIRLVSFGALVIALASLIISRRRTRH